MSDLLTLGASGARAAQTSLATVSENIANSGVAGYVRRSAINAEVSTAGVNGTNGYGVRIAGIQRSGDIFKTQAVRTAGTELARTTSAAEWLTSIQSALTSGDATARVTDFFNQATKLAADPSSSGQRTAMLESAAAAADAFTRTGNALAQVTTDLDTKADADTAKLTSLAEGLARVNGGLSRAVPGSAGAAGLTDERDRLLEEMSGLADISTSYDRFGRVTARLGGQSGPILVEGNIAGEVGYGRNTQGAVVFAVTREFQASTFVPTGGSLAGIGDAAGKVAGVRQSLDTIAKAFANGVNAAQTSGQDLNNAPGVALLTYDAQRPSQMRLATTGTPPATVTPDMIAAASPNTGPRDGGNLAAFAALRKTGGYETSLTKLTADNAAAIENRATVAAAQGAILEGAVTDRDTTMGVNLDNEAIDLLRFQQAYQASSRVIAVAKEIFQSLMEIR